MDFKQFVHPRDDFQEFVIVEFQDMYTYEHFNIVHKIVVMLKVIEISQ